MVHRNKHYYETLRTVCTRRERQHYSIRGACRTRLHRRKGLFFVLLFEVILDLSTTTVDSIHRLWDTTGTPTTHFLYLVKQ